MARTARGLRVVPFLAAITLAACGTKDDPPPPANRAPIAADDVFGVEQDLPLSVAAAQGVLANDVDPDGDALTAEVETGPAHGSVTLVADGAFTYVADPGFSGEDAFWYRATDLRLATATAKVTITVAASPSAPTADDDAYSVAEDSTLAVAAASGVLANDTAPGGGALGAVLVDGPAHGSVALASDGSFTYTPAANFTGADAFTYQATDALHASAPATVLLTITPVNDAPAAAADAFPATEDLTLTVPAPGVLANDGDIEGDALSAELVAPPAHGTVAFAGDGSFAYTPAAEFSGTDAFTYRASDGTLRSAPAGVTITVAPVNDPPVAALGAVTTSQGVGVAGRLAATDVDGDTLTFAIVSAPAHGTVVLTDAAGAFAYTPAPGYVGPDAFEFTASDGTLTSTAARVDVTVTGPPVPAISALFPARGGTGRPLQISGTHLGAGAGTVTVAGRPATVVSWSNTLVVVTVPTDLSPGLHDVVVTDAAAVSTSPAGYRVLPWIELVAPLVAAPGTALTLTGDGFGAVAGTAEVGGIAAAVENWTNTGVQIRVPAGVAGGEQRVKLTTGSGEASNVVSISIRGSDVWIRPPVPAGRESHSAVWTGTELIVWGGEMTAWGSRRVEGGGRYDPKTGGWSLTAMNGAPSTRLWHSAVWTGTEMIVWGGFGTEALATGGRYDPVTDSWRPMTAAGAPSARYRHAAAWTGKEMIVWGGSTASGRANTGARYEPATDTWTALPATGAPSARSDPGAVWTGKELIVWGGYNGTSALATGAVYDPVTDAWRPMTTVGAPSARYRHTAVWTGNEMLVYGGEGGGFVAGLYDPATDTWRLSSAASRTRKDHVGVWTGKQLFVYGGCLTVTSGCSYDSRGDLYDPATNTWTPLNLGARAYEVVRGAGVWTGVELIAWGGQGGPVVADTNMGIRVTPAGAYSLIVPPGSRSERRHPVVAWTGTELITFGGSTFSLDTHPFNDCSLFDPALDRWRDATSTGAPTARTFHAGVWTGSELIVWGGDGGSNTGGLYAPAADAWAPTTTLGAPPGRRLHTAIWSGSEMIVWGGNNLDSGGRYAPATDSWTATATAGAPAGRGGHTAVWTGTEMIVWGGAVDGGSASDTLLATGGRYDPAADAWIATATAGAPSARTGHTAVWTGSEMIVWGGGSDNTWTNTGGRYHPATDAWTPTSLAGAPAAMKDHVAVWTGTEMIVWDPWMQRGGRYDPATDTWRPMTSVGAAWKSEARAAVWTGTEMIVWGGWGNGREAVSRYLP